MSFLKRFFNRDNSITFCGRAGIIFRTEDKEYFIDSEMLSGDPSMVIYRDSVFYNNNRNIKLSKVEKDAVIKELLKKIGGKSVELFPANE